MRFSADVSSNVFEISESRASDTDRYSRIAFCARSAAVRISDTAAVKVSSRDCSLFKRSCFSARAFLTRSFRHSRPAAILLAITIPFIANYFPEHARNRMRTA